MSKYLILVLINLPLIITGVIGAITDYKANRTISKRKCIVLVLFWISIGIGLVAIEPIYNVLIRTNLTNSPPMSLFDVVLLTLVIFCLQFILKINQKIFLLNRKLARMHEKLAMLEVEQR